MLRAREVPGSKGAIVARFAPGAELMVVDGPEEADGRIWWRVRGTTGEGWCAAEYLLQVSATP